MSEPWRLGIDHGVSLLLGGAFAYPPDAERRRWLARLPDRPGDEAALRSSLFTERRPDPAPQPPAQPPQPAGGNVAHPAEKAGETFPAPENAVSAAAPAVSAADEAFSVSHPAFSPAEIAVIAVRIARGETKTAVVKQMPGYATRRHRAFAASYDRLYSQLAEQGLIEVGAGALSDTRRTDGCRSSQASIFVCPCYTSHCDPLPTRIKRDTPPLR